VPPEAVTEAGAVIPSQSLIDSRFEVLEAAAQTFTVTNDPPVDGNLSIRETDLPTS
jgi:hypothetical protein